MTAEHHDVVRREFARQSDGFGHRGSLFASRSLAEWIDAGARLMPDDLVLDAGGGAGDLSRTLAGRARQFVVADLTAALRDVGRDAADAARGRAGRAAADAAGVRNVLFVRAALEDLPFPDRSFDAVLCRFVVHHLADPAPALGELRRVCRSDGRVLVADLVAPDDAVAEVHSALEPARDPSHTTAFTEPALVAAVSAAGLAVRDVDRIDRRLALDAWLERVHTPPDETAAIGDALAAEMDGGPPTGLRPAPGGGGGGARQT